MSTNKSPRAAILWNIIWSMTAACINYFIQFLITPYITNNIGIEAYGFVALSTTMTTYLDIAAVGLNAFALRYISVAYHEGDKKKANVYFSSVIAGNAILAAFIIVFGFLATSRLELFLQIPEGITGDVKILFALVLVNYSLTLFRTVYNSAMYIENKLGVVERKKSVSYFLQAGVLLFLCMFFTPHVWYVGFAYIPATVYFLAQCFFISKKMTPDLVFKREDCSTGAVKDLISSGMWNSLNSLGNMLNSGLDLLITNVMISATVLGELSIAQNVAMVCYFLVQKISESFRPRQLYLYAKEDTKGQVDLFVNAMKMTGVFFELIVCGFFACGKDFLGLWVKGQNTDMLFSLSMLVLFSFVISSVMNPLYYAFTLTEKVKVPCLITIAMGLINVGSMYLLLRFTDLGVYAVVLTTLVLNTIHVIDTPLYAAHCLKVPYGTFYPVLLKNLFVLCLGMGMAFAFQLYLPMASSWGILAGKILLIGACLAAIMLPLMLGKKGLMMIINKLIKRGNKNHAEQ